ncbi:MAG: hypothetical protein JXA03_16305 [Bacteroidales bacterium]|nr:hypothetical protein [Bacteroidales bacterium]
MLFRLSIIIVLFSLFFPACKKDDTQADDWKNCHTCSIHDWKGSFSGRGSCFEASGNLTYTNQVVEITIAETGSNYLTVYIDVVPFVDDMISGNIFTPSSVSFAGTARAFSASLYVNSRNELKLTGSYKVFTSSLKDDDPDISKVVTFEVYKQ